MYVLTLYGTMQTHGPDVGRILLAGCVLNYGFEQARDAGLDLQDEGYWVMVIHTRGRMWWPPAGLPRNWEPEMEPAPVVVPEPEGEPQ